MRNPKYIFVTGGVTSSLGKGILCASLGKLLQSRGFRVTIQKLEPYINIDAGTMNPMEHGECYVTDDGKETDLDLGHYERFLDIKTSKNNYITSGQIYSSVIQRERSGGYNGKNIQVVPHITDAIKSAILSLHSDKEYDFIISEVGGCVGDIESLPYIEAIRQLRFSLAKEDFLSIHLTLVPYLSKAKELKTKPTQHSVKQLQSLGIQPDIIVCRAERDLPQNVREKISLFCNVPLDCVIPAVDQDTIYEVPVALQQEDLDKKVLSIMQVESFAPSDLGEWNVFLNQYKYSKEEIKIALVGKYVDVPDAYKSILEAVVHAGAKNNCKVVLDLISSYDLECEESTEEYVKKRLENFSGIIVGPGYGERGIEGKLNAIRFARKNNMPLFGICLGMQCMVVEFARNVLNYVDAASTEVNPKTTYPVIDLMEDQKNIKHFGGTNRLGIQKCTVLKGSKTFECYKQVDILERHRHRYEFNDKYRQEFEKSGMNVVGNHPDLGLVEIMEVQGHPWAVGTQYHPEYISTPQNPHPLFCGFIAAALNYSKS